MDRKVRLSNKDKKGVSLLFTSEATTQLALEEFEKALPFKRGVAAFEWSKNIKQLRMIQGQLAAMSTRFAESMRGTNVNDAIQMSFKLLQTAEKEVRQR